MQIKKNNLSLRKDIYGSQTCYWYKTTHFNLINTAESTLN